MSITIAQAIQSLKPGAEFSYQNEDYSTIKWDVLEGSAPTAKQITDEIKRLTTLKQAETISKAEAKTALLDRLGITAEEAQLLLS
jgi:hypothetical protein